MHEWRRLCTKLNRGTKEAVTSCVEWIREDLKAEEMIKFSLPRHRSCPVRLMWGMGFWAVKNLSKRSGVGLGRAHSRRVSIPAWLRDNETRGRAQPGGRVDQQVQPHTYMLWKGIQTPCPIMTSLSKKGACSPAYPICGLRTPLITFKIATNTTFLSSHMRKHLIGSSIMVNI